MLTNRTTHQRRPKATTASLFTESSYQSKLDILISSVPENLQAGIGMILHGMAAENISDHDKLKRAKIIVKLSQQPAIQNFIADMVNDEQAYQQNSEFIAKRMTDIQDQLKTETEHDPSFLEHLAKLLGAAALGGVVPGLGMVALGLPVAAAAGVPGIEWFAGQPAGGEDMCFGNTATCEQGYLAQAGKPETWFSQYSRNVEATVAGGTIDTSFANCLSLEKVGEAVANFFNANSTRTAGTDCIANSGIVHNTMSAIKATNLPLTDKDCSTFSKAMSGVYETCSNLPADQTKTIIIAAVAGTLGVAALVTVIVCCCKKRRQQQGYTNIV